MNKVNYDKLMQEQIALAVKSGKNKLLLHACCAPCSSSCIERLKEYFDITVYFYNPNMDSEKEYNLRAEEQKRLCQIMQVDCVIEKYNKEEFLSVVTGLENEREGGARCVKCFDMRLDKTAEYALKNGFNYFTTTLTVSPLKNADLLNKIGAKISSEKGVAFLHTDFKKQNGYKRSIELSKEYSLYRQNYCGCEFSKSE